jgi:hypothetical protein
VGAAVVGGVVVTVVGFAVEFCSVTQADRDSKMLSISRTAVVFKVRFIKTTSFYVDRFIIYNQNIRVNKNSGTLRAGIPLFGN